MPTVPKNSPATGEPTKPYFIHTLDCNFVDNNGRTLVLRGVNLSGSSKAPVNRPSQDVENLWTTAEQGGESFVGRPLNVDDGSADVHLARLRGWGFNMLRFPFTWEALEHEGPGKYDYDFMDYTVRVLRKCKEYGFKIFMDPHQDTWSRFSGGSGAPYWTVIACGLNPRNFTATQAAVIHGEYPLAHEADPANLPAMIWSTNYGRLASQTLFTFFFAGREFAPKCIIDGKNIQDWLQEHYIAAVGELADRIRDAGDLLDECVIEWDSMNEPFEGFCGWADLNSNPTKQGSTLKKGSTPTPAQSLRLGMGQKQTVEEWSFGSMGPSKDGTVTVDPKGRTIWLDPGTEPGGVHPKWGWRRDPGWVLGKCIWAQHGVWDIKSGYILRSDYFKFDPESDIEFIPDFWLKHFLPYAERVRASHPEAILFVAPPVFKIPPPIADEHLKGRCCYSAHYYDGLTLVSRHWNWFNADTLGLLRGKYSSTIGAAKIGESAIRKSFQEQMAMFKDDALILGSYPTIIGEIGIPYDMDDKRSYGWTDKGKYFGDYSRQQRALDASLNGCDGTNALNYTIWTYCPDSTHQWGDGWNMEDLSLWSADDLRCNRGQLLDGDGEDNTSGMKLPSSTSWLSLKKISAGSIGEAIAATTSTLSLSALGLANSMSDGLKARRITGWHENPYDFLTDGARAARAFSRPTPWKVVGRIKTMALDIGKASFRLVVTVRAEDKPNVDAESKEGPVVGMDGEDFCTEIYLPLVHFAHEKLLGSRSLAEDTTPVPTPYTGSTENLTKIPPEAFFSSSPSQDSVGSGGSVATLTPAAPPTVGKEFLDIEVLMSGGKWAVEGQVLRWWYEVPEHGQPDKEYTINIKRKGGVIRVKDMELQDQSWMETLSTGVPAALPELNAQVDLLFGH